MTCKLNERNLYDIINGLKKPMKNRNGGYRSNLQI